MLWFTVDHRGGPRQAGASGESGNPGRRAVAAGAPACRGLCFGFCFGNGCALRAPGISEVSGVAGRWVAGVAGTSAARNPELLAGEHDVAAQRVEVDDLMDDGAGVLVRIRALGHRPQAL